VPPRLGAVTRYAVFLLVPLVPWLQMRIDERLGAHRAQEDVLYLWEGEHVKRLALGFDLLMADIYWLRTVQYFGGQRVFAQGKRFDLLKPLTEITTTLDPRMEIAYRYGGIFLSEQPPAGAGLPREGIALLEKGVRANPRSWRLHQDLGMFHHLYLGDSQTASRILLEASQVSGAPYFLTTLAASLLVKGGDRAASREIWQRMYEQAEEGPIRQNAFIHLQILEAHDRADAIAQLVARFTATHERRPSRLEELAAAGLLRGAPVDPSGTPFAYDPQTGSVTVSRQSPLWRAE
jgi:hypothetical protein